MSARMAGAARRAWGMGRPRQAPGRSPRLLPRAQGAARTAAQARMGLALFNALVVYLDPTLPPGDEWSRVLVVNVSVWLILLYSAGLLWAGLARPPSPRAARSILALDVLFGAALIESTGALHSPFFMWDAFVLMNGTAIGGWPVARWVLAGQMCLYLAAILALPPLGWDVRPLAASLLRFAYLNLAALVLSALTWQIVERNRVLTAIHRAGVHLSAGSSTMEILDRLAQSAADLLRGEPVAAAGWSDGTAPEPVAVRGLAPAEEPLLIGAARRCLDAAGPAEGPATVISEDPDDHLHLAGAGEALAGAGHLLVTRVPAGHGRAGVLVVARRHRFSPAEVEIAELLAVHTGALLETASLHQERFSQAARDERYRIAGELHDGLVQTLGGLSLSLAACRESQKAGCWEELAEELQALEQVAEEAVDEARGAIHELAPIRLRQAGLAAYLDDYLRRFRRRCATPVRASFRLPHGVPPEPVAILLMSLLREGLNNIRRHARADHASLTIEQQGKSITFRLVDDGIGVDPGLSVRPRVPGRHCGLAYLRARVIAAGGTMTIASRPGQGTALEVRLPCDSDEPSTPGSIADGGDVILREASAAG